MRCGAGRKRRPNSARRSPRNVGATDGSRWGQPLGFIKVFRSNEWPAYHTGGEVGGQELDELLADPSSWKYTEEPTRWICVASGDRDIQELEEGMCDQEA